MHCMSDWRNHLARYVINSLSPRTTLRPSGICPAGTALLSLEKLCSPFASVEPSLLRQACVLDGLICPPLHVHHRSLGRPNLGESLNKRRFTLVDTGTRSICNFLQNVWGKFLPDIFGNFFLFSPGRAFCPELWTPPQRWCRPTVQDN